jgi:long-chain acyl-CoA synthetase
MSTTVCHRFLQTAKKHASQTAFMHRRGGRWLEETWQRYQELVETTAAGLQSLGVVKGDRIAVFSNTRYEWAVADLAILGLGALTVPIYQNSTPEDIEFILENCGPKVLICETPSMARKIKERIRNHRSLERVIYFTESKEESVLDSSDGRELTLSEVQDLGETALKNSPSLYQLAVQELKVEDSASVIYTSGTTGRPRGVLLTHTQILSQVAEAFPLLGVTQRDRSLCFLPFAHILGRIEIWGHALIGYTMAYAESIERIKNNLVEVKPTLIVAVPRIFEKIYNAVIAQAEVSPVRKKVFDWAVATGRDISKYKVQKMPVPLDLAMKYQLAKKLVFNSITERLGGELRFAVCGGAPMSRPIAEFFHAAGVLILEGYGLTETTAAITVNTPFDYRFGSVGKAVGEVKLMIAEDGEILVQSKKVMKEYYNDRAATAQAIVNGWFHTGDIGELSPEGYLTITDRKKDLIKTAGGKYVAPQKLEGLLKVNHFISQAHIHGDQQKYIVALLTLNFDAVKSFAEEQDISYKDQESLVTNTKIKELMRRAIAEANSHLASFETIKNFAILPTDFTIESGELTPSLKVKRKVVDLRYADLIAGLYN